MTFNRTYFILTIFLFITEVFIALFVHDGFFRPYFGDVLVVILIYCFIKTFFNFAVWKTALFVTVFSICIETLQYLNFIAKIGLEESGFAKAILGHSFSWWDILCYLIGILIVVSWETLRMK
ncbi:MAG TPA: DUF2809 domain-containing protein [Flavobacteriaceae bacterium]|nr:DUF2809 domain-containing protein [Flavobacteriaceae bacterium]